MCYSIIDVEDEIVELKNSFRRNGTEVTDIYLWRIEQILNGLFNGHQRRNDVVLAVICEIEELIRNVPGARNKNSLIDIIREKRREIRLTENLQKEKRFSSFYIKLFSIYYF